MRLMFLMCLCSVVALLAGISVYQNFPASIGQRRSFSVFDFCSAVISAISCLRSMLWHVGANVPSNCCSVIIEISSLIGSQHIRHA